MQERLDDYSYDFDGQLHRVSGVSIGQAKLNAILEAFYRAYNMNSMIVPGKNYVAADPEARKLASNLFTNYYLPEKAKGNAKDQETVRKLKAAFDSVKDDRQSFSPSDPLMTRRISPKPVTLKRVSPRPLSPLASPMPKPLSTLAPLRSYSPKAAKAYSPKPIRLSPRKY